jgi:hypothetical protein
MIVQHLTWTVKLGYMDKFVELIKTEVAKNPQFRIRILISSFGKTDTLIEEFEFENMAEFEKIWNEWFAKPESADFVRKFEECREPGGENTIWDLIETK